MVRKKNRKANAAIVEQEFGALLGIEPGSLTGKEEEKEEKRGRFLKKKPHKEKKKKSAKPEKPVKAGKEFRRHKTGGKDIREARPMRQVEAKYRISTKNLWIILAALWVILIIAMAWQQYYDSHTYEKGELARMAEENPLQRRKFLEEPEFSDMAVTKITEAVTEIMPEGEPAGVVENVENIPGMSDDDEQNSIVDLREQLIGVLPGVR